MAEAEEFYLRYYTGHKGKFGEYFDKKLGNFHCPSQKYVDSKLGHEFLEFEFRPDGKMRYANNSNYKNDTMIRKEVFVNEVMDCLFGCDFYFCLKELRIPGYSGTVEKNRQGQRDHERR
jgi:hypothetical protein